MSFKDYNPQRVEVWDDDTYETEYSTREYYTISDVRGIYEDRRDGYYSRAEPASLTLYLDPLTGTVVWDVAAYEKSLKPAEEPVEEAPIDWNIVAPTVPTNEERLSFLHKEMSDAEPGARVYSSKSGRRFTKREDGQWYSTGGVAGYWPFDFNLEFELEN